MENSYGIGITNRYELFIDNESDSMVMPKKSKKKKNAEKENKLKVEKPTETLKKTETVTKPLQKVTSQGNTKSQNGAPRQNVEVRGEKKFADREERNNRLNKSEGQQEKSEYRGNVSSRFGGEPRPRGGRTGEFPRGGRGMSRGGRGGRGGTGEYRGKRDFERQSGMATSTVRGSDKKEGGGSHNWGSDRETIDTEVVETEAKDTEKANVSGDETADVGGEADAAAKEEEEPKEMTLDEWKASQKREKPQFNVRKAGEGESKEQWKESFVLKKKEVPSAEALDDQAKQEEQNKAKANVPLLDFQFSDGQGRGRFRGGGGGRGRGGPPTPRGRGARGGRGGRGYQSGGKQEAPKMDNELDFPSLG